MNAKPPAILDHLSALADTIRSRILLLLDRHELSVSELCAIMQLPQSTVSRHLKALADSGWIVSRAEGTSNVYAMARDDMDGPTRRLWLLVREQVGPTAAATQDERRLRRVLLERRTKSQEFFASSAGHWDKVRDELFGNRFHFAALAGFLDASWVVGDLGCGTGQLSAALAPFVSRIVAVDASATHEPDVPGVVVIGMGAAVLALALPDPVIAVVAATSGGLAGILVAAPVGSAARAAFVGLR